MAAEVHKFRPLRSLNPSYWHGRKPPPRDWLIDGVALRKTVCLFNGPGSAGKSLLMLQMMASAALGASWLGRPIPQVKSFGIFAEDPEDEVWRRMQDVATSHGVDVADLDLAEMIPSDWLDGGAWLYRGPQRSGLGEFTPLWKQIKEFCLDEGRQLIVLDNVAMLFGGNPIAPEQVTHFMDELKQLAIKVNGVVVLLQHPSQDGIATKSGESGSRMWSNLARSRMFITFPPEFDDPDSEPTDERVLRFMKANYGPRHKGLRVEWREGVFAPLALSDAQGQLTTSDEIELASKLLAELNRLMDAGERVTVTFGSSKHIATVLLKRPEWRRYHWKEIDQAAMSLVRSNRAAVIELGPPSKRMKLIRPIDRQFPDEKGGLL